MTAPAGPDGLRRCDWAYSAPEYIAYHDTEWGRPVHGDDAVYERMVLEAFQSGLSFITILRKRPAFRAAFAGFSIAAVAQFTEADVEVIVDLLLPVGVGGSLCGLGRASSPRRAPKPVSLVSPSIGRT